MRRTTCLVLLPLFVLISAPGLWQTAVGLGLTLLGVGVARRRRRLKAWERELDVAFRVDERQELSLRPVL